MCAHYRRLIELTSLQKEIQRTLPDWLRMEYGIGKPSNKLLALTELDSNTWVSEVKRIGGKKQPLSSSGLQAFREEHTRTIAPPRALAAETLTLERTLSDLVNQANALTTAAIALMWQTAPPRLPVLRPSSLLNKACFTDSTVEFPREVAYFCTQEGVVQQSASLNNWRPRGRT